MTRLRGSLALLLALAMMPAFGIASAATVVIVNTDGAGEGFNDLTPAAPVGGNSGTTLGAQRLRVFQEAANVWGALLPSAVPIRVRAGFDPLACDANSAVLGSAGPVTAAFNFPDAPCDQTFYHIALANKLAGQDLSGNDDIQARFNSSVDDPVCLGANGWYYGLDHDNGADFDLFAVVLHELGHGLGFSTLVDLATGQEPLPNTTDAYARYLLDTVAGKHWDEMSDAERAASATRGSLVWDGSHVTAAAPTFLSEQPFVRVNAPPDIDGNLVFAQASFSPVITTAGVTAHVVLADPPTACSPLVNGAALQGKIALIDRGSCAFVDKAVAAQQAGAAAVMIANNVSGGPVAMSGEAPGLTIPVVGITQSDGTLIKNRLAGGVNATIAADTNRLAGANAQGKVLLYAPDPLEQGSSVSHWDTETSPDLLMEPFITDGLSSSVDLTFAAFEDLGWTGAADCAPTAVLASLVAAESDPDRVRLRWFVATTGSVAVERRGSATGWSRLGEAAVDPRGYVDWEDRTVEAGERYQYRLQWTEPDGAIVAGEVWVEVPRTLQFVLRGAQPNPTAGAMRVSFTLPAAGRARLEIFDMAGRRVGERQEMDLTAGFHLVPVSMRTRLAAGIYLLRLTFEGRNLETRAVVTD